MRFRPTAERRRGQGRALHTILMNPNHVPLAAQPPQLAPSLTILHSALPCPPAGLTSQLHMGNLQPFLGPARSGRDSIWPATPRTTDQATKCTVQHESSLYSSQRHHLAVSLERSRHPPAQAQPPKITPEMHQDAVQGPEKHTCAQRGHGCAVGHAAAGPAAQKLHGSCPHHSPILPLSLHMHPFSDSTTPGSTVPAQKLHGSGLPRSPILPLSLHRHACSKVTTPDSLIPVPVGRRKEARQRPGHDLMGYNTACSLAGFPVKQGLKLDLAQLQRSCVASSHPAAEPAHAGAQQWSNIHNLCSVFSFIWQEGPWLQRLYRVQGSFLRIRQPGWAPCKAWSVPAPAHSSKVRPTHSRQPGQGLSASSPSILKTGLTTAPRTGEQSGTPAKFVSRLHVLSSHAMKAPHWQDLEYV